MNSTGFDHRKRARENDDEIDVREGLFEKKARPTTEVAERWNQRDSVISPPVDSSQTREPFRLDSDDENASSIISDESSPRDVSMSSDDDAMGGGDLYSQSPEEAWLGPRRTPDAQTWTPRLQTHRVATPMLPPRPAQIRTSFMTHVRQRHPQEVGSEQPQQQQQQQHLEVPSPIDEDEVPTPPSAAEAAGSQLSMLSVNDVDMSESGDNAGIPTISIHPARPTFPPPPPLIPGMAGAPIVVDASSLRVGPTAMEGDDAAGTSPTIMVRKQRRRSGALSSGDSPVRAGPSTATSKRGFTMGFRADCEKCQMRVPGHMNHFIS